MRKIVLTGGPFSGKSTLAEQLGAEGFAVAPEAAIRVIEQLVDELGPERARTWRVSHPHDFQVRIVRLQLELEAEAERSGAEWIVCDRGLLDGIAYCHHWGVPTPSVLEDAVAHTRYYAVLLLDTLASFEARAQTGRVDDHRDSVRLRELIQRVYVEHDYRPVVIPERPPAERAALVREVIATLGQA